jgi:hypothetical protein
MHGYSGKARRVVIRRNAITGNTVSHISTTARTRRCPPDRYWRISKSDVSRSSSQVRATGDGTKGSFNTTEFWLYLAAVAGVLIASYAAGTI